MLGCDSCCNGCQNPDLKNYMFNHSTIIEYTVNNFFYNLIKECKRQSNSKVVFSGGDPLNIFNIDLTKNVSSKIGS
jgi:organic radical activating enzyme